MWNRTLSMQTIIICNAYNMVIYIFLNQNNIVAIFTC